VNGHGAANAEGAMKTDEHWNQIWAGKQPTEVSWFEAEPAT
jgi:hypothetical protein